MKNLNIKCFLTMYFKHLSIQIHAATAALRSTETAMTAIATPVTASAI